MQGFLFQFQEGSLDVLFKCSFCAWSSLNLIFHEAFDAGIAPLRIQLNLNLLINLVGVLKKGS